MGKEKPIGIKMFQGVLFAGVLIIFFSKDVLREVHFFAGIMGLCAFVIEAYYYFNKK